MSRLSFSWCLSVAFTVFLMVAKKNSQERGLAESLWKVARTQRQVYWKSGFCTLRGANDSLVGIAKGCKELHTHLVFLIGSCVNTWRGGSVGEKGET